MKQTSIGFIGGGNMAASLIGGLIHDGCQAQMLWASDPDAQRLGHLGSHFGINTSGDNLELIEACDVVVLAVKPQVLATVAKDINRAVQQHRPLIISIAAGIRSGDLDGWLGGGTSLVRVMPNTPSLVQSGAAALYAGTQVDAGQRDLAESIMRAVGLALWVDDEGQMDAVTALSGSGPAYFLLVMEAMEKAAQTLGLSPDVARLLTLQTAFGAAKMALESDQEVAELRRRVTSPGGTTEAALAQLTGGDLEGLFAKALTAARDRSQELAEQLGEQPGEQ
jgi:pyrroline-5-carboxylate reductase